MGSLLRRHPIITWAAVAVTFVVAVVAAIFYFRSRICDTPASWACMQGWLGILASAMGGVLTFAAALIAFAPANRQAMVSNRSHLIDEMKILVAIRQDTSDISDRCRSLQLNLERALAATNHTYQQSLISVMPQVQAAYDEITSFRSNLEATKLFVATTDAAYYPMHALSEQTSRHKKMLRAAINNLKYPEHNEVKLIVERIQSSLQDTSKNCFDFMNALDMSIARSKYLADYFRTRALKS